MIGYLLKMYPRFSETFILGEILELERRGRAIRIISLKKPDDGRFHEGLARVRAGVSYLPERFPGHPLLYIRSHLRALRRRPGAYLSALLQALGHLPGSWKGWLRAPLVVEAAAAAGCRRLHAHFASLPAITAMFASRLAGIPFTFTAHAKDIYLRGRSKRLLRALIRRAERVVTVSEFNRAHLGEIGGPALPPERIVRIYNGVDLERFRPASPAGAGTEPLVLAVGRLVEKKGFADLVEACAILMSRGIRFRCTIVGAGALRGDLERRIAARGLAEQVDLAGPQPQGEIARLLQRADVLAVPSIVARDGNREGLPQVILEAMACGVPVVATRVTGIPEAVQEGVTGRVVEPGDPAAFAAALAELVNAPLVRARLGRAARERAEQLFDLRRNVDRLDEVLALGVFPAAREETDRPSAARAARAAPAEQARPGAASGAGFEGPS